GDKGDRPSVFWRNACRFGRSERGHYARGRFVACRTCRDACAGNFGAVSRGDGEPSISQRGGLRERGGGLSDQSTRRESAGRRRKDCRVDREFLRTRKNTNRAWRLAFAPRRRTNRGQ